MESGSKKMVDGKIQSQLFIARDVGYLSSEEFDMM